MRILTLLTDFGLRDPYVGMVKGAIAQVNPSLTVIDLTHQIPPQNIALARFSLMSAYPYFPRETVHVAVVDPGVGSDRRGVALAIGSNPSQPVGFLVGPDNGLFSGVISQTPVISVVSLTNRAYWRTAEPSFTFHGRDIFAPVAAHLASGVPLEKLGEVISPDALMQLELPDCFEAEDLENRVLKITGCIQAVDQFGNLITNIPGPKVLNSSWSIVICDHTLPGRQTYSEVMAGELLALVGSHGWIEIAVNHGSAQERLDIEMGASVQAIARRGD